MSNPSKLEKRIASALALVSDIASVDLADLIEEVETAAAAADKAAEQARVRALDPARIDPAARAAMADAEFLSQRLQAALPRLDQRFAQAQAAESAALWDIEYQEIEGRRDRLAEEYARVYPEAVAQLTDLFERAAAIDKDGSRLNGSAPRGEHRRMLGVELTARDLTGFTATSPSLADQLKLPDFERSSEMRWPPPTIPFAVQVASAMAFAPMNPNWWDEIEQRNNARREEAKRVADYHKRQAQDREERENAEARARRAAQSRP